MDKQPRNWRPWQRAGAAAVKFDSKRGRSLLAMKGAKASNIAQRKRGMIPGAAARAARKRYAAERRAKVGLPATATKDELYKVRKALAKKQQGEVKARSGSANLDGV